MVQSIYSWLAGRQNFGTIAVVQLLALDNIIRLDKSYCGGARALQSRSSHAHFRRLLGFSFPYLEHSLHR